MKINLVLGKIIQLLSYALTEITKKIKESIDIDKFCCGIFIGTAVDTVNHDILLNKLEYYGTRGVILEWFRSYLTNRETLCFL